MSQLTSSLWLLGEDLSKVGVLSLSTTLLCLCGRVSVSKCTGLVVVLCIELATHIFFSFIQTLTDYVTTVSNQATSYS